MRPLAATVLALALTLSVGSPARADDGATGGLAGVCQDITAGQVEEMAAEIRAMSGDGIAAVILEMVEDDDTLLAGLEALSGVDMDKVIAEWREILLKVPVVLRTFCVYYSRDALPGVVPGPGHGSLEFARELFFVSSDSDPEQGRADPVPGENDCEKPYPLTLELDKRTTMHVFCEFGSEFVLTSSYRADATDRWTRID